MPHDPLNGRAYGDSRAACRARAADPLNAPELLRDDDRRRRHQVRRVVTHRGESASPQGAIQFDTYGPLEDRSYWAECERAVRELLQACSSPVLR
jgi:hypothetical protein